MIDEPEGTESWNGEGHTVSPLGRDGRVWSVSAAMVEAEQENDEQGLVEKLTPTLHQKGAGDLSATMQTVFLCGYFSRSNGIFHTAGGSHWVFTADTNAVEKERPDVADNPAVLSNTPRGGQHDQSEKHDNSILD